MDSLDPKLGTQPGPLPSDENQQDIWVASSNLSSSTHSVEYAGPMSHPFQSAFSEWCTFCGAHIDAPIHRV